MSETRRELFKKSVLSAFGLMSAGAVTSCGPHAAGGKGRRAGKPRIPLDAVNTVILGWNEYADNVHTPPVVPIWYVFHKSQNGWEVYTYDGSLSDPNTSAQGSFDDYNWYLKNKVNLTRVSSKFKFMNSGTTVTYDFTNGYLSSTSRDYLESLVGATGYFSQATWNEIGRS